MSRALFLNDREIHGKERNIIFPVHANLLVVFGRLFQVEPSECHNVLIPLRNSFDGWANGEMAKFISPTVHCVPACLPNWTSEGRTSQVTVFVYAGEDAIAFDPFSLADIGEATYFQYWDCGQQNPVATGGGTYPC